MVNKFKDFIEKLKGFVRRKSSRADRAESTDDISVDRDELATDSDNEVHFQKLNRFTPYIFKIKRLLAPIGAAFAATIGKTLKKTTVGQKLKQQDWGLLADKLLDKESLTQHHRAFIALLLLVSAYSIGKLTALVARGRPDFPTPKSTALSDIPKDFEPALIDIIKQKDPFRTQGAQGPSKIADNKCDTADARSSLPIKLVNTVVLQDSVKSIAAVQVRSGRELKEFREGDSVDGMARITKIARLELIIKNLETGACESIANEKILDAKNPISIMDAGRAQTFKQQKKIKGIENQGNKFIIDKTLLDEKLKDISSILTQARAIKIQQPDGSLAFKITEVEAGSIFSFLGIQNEDIITSINGKPISDLNEVMGLFGRLKNIDQLQLGVRREGENNNMEYVMKK